MTSFAKKIFALVAIFVAGSIFTFTYLHAAVVVTNNSDVDSGLPPAGSAYVLTAASSSDMAGAPARIRIPKIGVDAGVADVGLGKTGNMAVPYTFTDAGWYRYGTLPGQMGSAVLDGHVDNGLGTPAVFARLGELEAGDDIYIDTKEGATLHFRVEEAQAYDLQDVPLQKIFNRKDAPRLTLITCEGTWNESQKMYDERRVVYAVLQNS
jgi:LPXTG-site transpeptidase (sortase) family protein